MNILFIESSQLLLFLGATILISWAWLGSSKQDQHKETVARLDELVPVTSKGVGLSKMGGKDWTVIALLICLIAHNYTEVFQKHQNESLNQNDPRQPELVPVVASRPAVILTTDLSIEGCRKILEQNGQKYSDEQVLKIKKRLHNLCLLDYELFLKMKTPKT